MRKYLFLLISIGFFAFTHAQNRADVLRGSLSPERTCYDVLHYDLRVDIDINEQYISGSNRITFKAVNNTTRLQIDLYANMQIDSVLYRQKKVTFEREYNAVFIKFPTALLAGSTHEIKVFYQGKPTVAKNAPWDGGFVWSKDKNNKPWVGVACEGDGASLWWPVKDHLSDEPESMRMSYTIPKGLFCVGNGNLIERKKVLVDGKRKETFVWDVSYPINNYNVTLNIADYVHFSDNYMGIEGEYPLDYYVLSYNRKKAEEHFQQVKPMLACFEEMIGAYPFPKDGYALVETPYLGMEHQSAIAYGNNYQPGYAGRYPGEMDFDYLIIHETGHEWWGNSVSMNDVADMWIHESFCTYSEAIFAECTYGYSEMLAYLWYQRNFITNLGPISGVHGLNKAGNATDMYYKGSWMLHTLRNVLNDDEQWSDLIRGIAAEFRVKNVDRKDIIDYINQKTGTDYSLFFNQYLDMENWPVFQYRLKKRKGQYFMQYRWRDAVKGFDMPVWVGEGKKRQRIMPSKKWQKLALDNENIGEFLPDEHLFLINLKEK